MTEDNERASTGPWGWASGAEVEGDSRTLSGAASTLVIDLGDVVKERLEQGGMLRCAYGEQRAEQGRSSRDQRADAVGGRERLPRSQGIVCYKDNHGTGYIG